MSKEILLTIEKFHDGEENQFLIQSSKEIQLLLQAIAKNNSFVILYFNDEQRFLKTLLLGANEQGIWLDVSPNEEENDALLNSDSFTFVTQHHGAKVQFVCHHTLMAVYASHPAFYFPLPQHILRLQRRDYFRINIPFDEPLKCIIPPRSDDEHQYEVPLKDISLGGVGLVCKGKGIRLQEGALYPDCRIELPNAGTLIATLQVRYLLDLGTLGRTTIRHAGCQFIHLDSRMSVMLQRYIAIIQSKLSGFR